MVSRLEKQLKNRNSSTSEDEFLFYSMYSDVTIKLKYNSIATRSLSAYVAFITTQFDFVSSPKVLTENGAFFFPL